MNTKIKTYLAVGLTLVSGYTFGFTTATHTAITSYAFSGSNLSKGATGEAVDPSKSVIASRLGLGEWLLLKSNSPFRYTPAGLSADDNFINDCGAKDCYIVLTDGSTAQWMKANAEFEMRIARSVRDAIPSISSDYTLGGWLIRGAIREDDNNSETPLSDEPGGVFNRVFGHFYDPYNNVGLAGPKSPDWAQLSSATIVNGFDSRYNIYNIPNAYETLWRALTGTRRDGTDATPSGTGAGTSKETVRQAYWAATFRTLGDIMHLLEDAAQPQHTRNDPHSGVGCVGDNCALGHASFFEEYLSGRTLQTGTFKLKEGDFSNTPTTPIDIKQPQLNFDAYYPIPNQFTSFLEFFGKSGPADNSDGQGLANYTNRGFVTRGTNFDSNSGYPLPNPGSLSRLTVAPVKDIQGQDISGASITFLIGDVQDTLIGSLDSSIKLSTYGTWNEFLAYKGSASYTLNYYNYNDMAALAIPRAVGYSAGLVNFFFRGKLEISQPPEGVYAVADHSTAQGFSQINLHVKNVTPNNEALAGGDLVAVAKFHKNNCYQADLSGEYGSPDKSSESCRSGGMGGDGEEILLSDKISGFSLGVGAQAEKDLTFKFQTPIPFGISDLYIQLVYRGTLGQENDTVVVATKNISEPTYFAYHNDSDYIHIGGSVYTRDEVSSNQDLLAQVFPKYCVSGSAGSLVLSDSCLQPLVLNQKWAVNDSGKTVAEVTGLQARHFVRLALLSETTPDPVVTDSVATCQPNSGPISTLENNWNIDAGYYVSSAMTSWRSVPGWEQWSCVLNGDGSAVGSEDDRETKMSVLNDAEKQPVSVQKITTYQY